LFINFYLKIQILGLKVLYFVLEHIHRCSVYNVLWRVVPVVDESICEECLPCCSSTPWLGGLRVCPRNPCLSRAPVKNLSWFTLSIPSRTLSVSIKLPRSLLLFREYIPDFFSLFSYFDFPKPSIILLAVLCILSRHALSYLSPGLFAIFQMWSDVCVVYVHMYLCVCVYVSLSVSLCMFRRPVEGQFHSDG